MPSYAVIAIGGKQYRVRSGEQIVVDRLAQEPGESFRPDVLATGDESAVADGGSVTAVVEEHMLGQKVRVFTYKAKRNSRRQRGHRSRLSRVRIESIEEA